VGTRAPMLCRYRLHGVICLPSHGRHVPLARHRLDTNASALVTDILMCYK